MPNCPKDGTEVKNPVKEWDLSPKSRKGPKLHIKLFECPTCGYRWRVVEKVG
jgi:predicted secreted protein